MEGIVLTSELIRNTIDMKRPMSKTALERTVLGELGKAREPSSPRVLLDKAKSWHVAESDVREVIWRLLEKQQIELTPDRRLRARSQRPLRAAAG